MLETRRVHPGWGPRRIAFELRSRHRLVLSESGVYRCLVRAGLIEPDQRRRRRRDWKRWERGRANELWQMDVVGGFGTHAKALTGVDDHSRFCVSATLMPREHTRPVCDALAAALRLHGVPTQILTDNGKVFTGRFFSPPVEVRWVTRKVASNGVVCVDWQKVSLGKHRGGQQCDVFVTDQLIQFWIGPDLLRTVQRNRTGEVRKKHAIGTGQRA